MDPVEKKEEFNKVFYYVVEIAIRLGFLALLVAWCFQIIIPFSGVILWGIIIALMLAPTHRSLSRKFGNSPKLAASLLVICGIGLIVLPSWLFLESTVSGLQAIRSNLEAGTLTIPPPSEKVHSWPVIGNKVYQVWNNASQNLGDIIAQYREQIINIGSDILEKAMGIGGSILRFILAMIIGGVLLVTPGTENMARKFFARLVGAKGDEFTYMVAGTVRNVAKGVIGVALIQSFLAGVGFLILGVPHAGLWSLIVLILAILQIPALIIILPVVIWMFSALSTLPAILGAIYLIVVGASDNFLKPILLGKGATVPMLVIFLGVLGGFMFSGFIGLFTGAIITSIGYKLFISWLEDDFQNIQDKEVLPE